MSNQQNLCGWPNAETLAMWNWLVNCRENQLFFEALAVLSTGTLREHTIVEAVTKRISVRRLRDPQALLPGIDNVDWFAIAETMAGDGDRIKKIRGDLAGLS